MLGEAPIGLLRSYPYQTGKGCQGDPNSSQDAIKRRFNRVLARFTIWSILFGLGTTLGLGLLGVGPLGCN